jgi:hypothetical protein
MKNSITKILLGSVVFGFAALGLAIPAYADPTPNQGFVSAVRAVGITGADPAVLEDGYNVCFQLWNQQIPAVQVAAGLRKDYSTLTADQSAHFVVDAYQNLCPTSPIRDDYWAYGTDASGGGGG